MSFGHSLRADALMLAGAVAIAAGWWFSDPLPARARLLPEMSGEPLQTAPRTTAAFAARMGGVDYRVQPVADYELYGLVVSRHDANIWWDWIHAASNDHLNAVDLCVIWGVNAADGAYERIKFWSGQFVCYFQTSDMSVAKPQYFRALSNNHLLTDDPSIARALRRVRIGDQIRISGQLAEYSHNHGFAFHRGTSITRDDTGNGACETIFVRELSVLRRADAWPRWLFYSGIAALLLGLLVWFATPHRPRN